MFYQLQHPLTDEVISIVMKKDDQLFFIPLDENNSDYERFLLWLLAGNTAPAWIPEEHDLLIVTPDAN
jgi:hypothetical protein